MREEFYDERGVLVRAMSFSDVRSLGGRTILTGWEMRPVGKPANVTTVVTTSATYYAPIPADISSAAQHDQAKSYANGQGAIARNRYDYAALTTGRTFSLGR